MAPPTPQHERRVARTFLTLGTGDAAARIISFGAFVYLARTLGAEAFGTLELAAAIVLYGARFVDLGFDLGLGVRETAAGDQASLARLLGTALVMRVTSAILVIGLTAGLGLWLLPTPEGQVVALYALTLLAVGLGTRWFHLGFERSRLIAFSRVVGEVVMVATVLLFVNNPDDLLRVPLARFGGDMLAAAALLFGAWRVVRSRGRFDRALARRLLPRSVPLVASAIFGLMIFNADLVFLRVFEGRAAVGYYAAGYALTSFLSNLGIAYALSLLPALTRLSADPEERGALYRTAHAQVATVGIGVAMGGALLAAPIVGLIFGSSYEASVLPLAIVIWSVPLSLVRDLPVTALMSDGVERPIMTLTGRAAVINIVLNLVFVPQWGMAGAATATVITEAARWGLAARAAGRIGFRGPALGRYGKGVFAAICMCAVLVLVRDRALWISIASGSLVWLIALAAVGGVRRNAGRGVCLNV